jgi:hypothetical protein
MVVYLPTGRAQLSVVNHTSLDLLSFSTSQHHLQGDLPIGVDKRSVDTWMEPQLFRMDKSTGGTTTSALSPVLGYIVKHLFHVVLESLDAVQGGQVNRWEGNSMHVDARPLTRMSNAGISIVALRLTSCAYCIPVLPICSLFYIFSPCTFILLNL